MQSNIGQTISVAFFIAIFLFPFILSAEEIRVDNLPESSVGSFPKDWKTYPFQKNKTRRVYRVKENTGHKYIEALDEKFYSVPIFKDFNWDIKKYPYIKFKWRAQQLPTGAKEVGPETNDSGCGVYIGFSRTRALKYVWSDGLTPESFWAKNPGKFAIISKEMGPTHLGKWQSVTVDIPKDYQHYFEKPLDKNPIGIGIMSDGNAVKKTAACDYTDFYISSTP